MPSRLRRGKGLAARSARRRSTTSLHCKAEEAPDHCSGPGILEVEAREVLSPQPPARALAVLQDLADGVVARDAAHAAAAVRRGAGLIEPLDRGAVVGVAGGGAHVEQL